MNPGFEEEQARFDHGSQQARVWTEGWVAREMFCLNCGAPRLRQLRANSPVADFDCEACADQYEVKSTKGASFGPRVVDGAYDAKMARLGSATNPHLMLLSYSAEALAVRSVCVVSKHFFVPEIIQRRKPLAPTARRAGWVGSNILLREVPEAGRIFVLRNGTEIPRDEVLAKWKQTLFLGRTGVEARGWLIDVMKAVELIGRPELLSVDGPLPARVVYPPPRLPTTFPRQIGGAICGPTLLPEKALRLLAGQELDQLGRKSAPLPLHRAHTNHWRSTTS